MLNRNINLILNYLLDNFIPPILRDCKLFMWPVIRYVYGSKTDAIMGFKEKLPFMTEDELSGYYELIKDAPINKRETDLNTACLDYILNNIVGESILDAACGRGGLLKKLRDKWPNMRLHGCDLVMNQMDVPCTQASLYSIPFNDNSFDTVICTHALEHVRDHKKALNELVRVCGKRLIIVVPKQREYLYTPNLHVHFLPYLYRFKIFIGIEAASYFNLKGDFLCVIDKSIENNLGG